MSLLNPLTNYEFMQNAFFAVLLSALMGPPLGVILIQKRLTLIGDSLSHALLPGVGIAFYFFGGNNTALMLGALLTGLLVVILSNYISKKNRIFEEASFAGIYLISLALGVVFVSLKGSNNDIMHLLFGQPLETTQEQVVLIGIFSLFTFLAVLAGKKAIALEVMDPDFLKVRGLNPLLIHRLFMLLLVCYLVITFRITGTLLSIGLMLLPALSAKLWSRTFYQSLIWSAAIGLASSYLGSWFSFHFDLPMSSSILLFAGVFFIFGILLSPNKGIFWQWLRLKHYKH